MSTRFAYNLELEMALRNFFGNRYYQKASGFIDPENVKKAMFQTVEKIRKVVGKIKADQRFYEIVNVRLDLLENEIKQLDQTNNDWKIIACLMSLVSTLLGYDWTEGKQYRKPKYYQTPTQKKMSLMKP